MMFELSTHGGSLRIYAAHKENNEISINKSVNEIIDKEKSAYLDKMEGYYNFEKKIQILKWKCMDLLIKFKKEKKRIAAYGAAAKGNTFLNYCGIKADLIDFVADASPHKQGKYLPQSHIPIVSENILKREKPDYIIILPWNLFDEISAQLNYTKEWGAKLITAIPEMVVHE